jgi:hypothetical protein
MSCAMHHTLLVTAGEPPHCVASRAELRHAVGIAFRRWTGQCSPDTTGAEEQRVSSLRFIRKEP